MKPKGFYLNQVYQWANWKDDATIVDLGAWNGTTSYWFSLKTPKGKVIAVEPVKEIMALCIEKCKDTNNVVFCSYAISDEISEVEINIYKNKSEANSLFFKKDERYELEKKEKVQTITWDNLVDLFKIEKVDFCKVNIEGAETLLLKGMTKVFPKKMIIEQHDRVGITNMDELLGLIKQKGYRIVKEYKCDLYCIYEGTI